MQNGSKISKLAFVGSMIGLLSTLGEARIVDSACIKSEPLFGGNKSNEVPEKGEIDGDMADLGSMSLMQLAYSRPTDLLICAD